jgi:hypothetical protein
VTVTKFHQIASIVSRNGIHVCPRLHDFYPHGTDMVLSVMTPNPQDWREILAEEFALHGPPEVHGAYTLQCFRVQRTEEGE